MPVRVSAMSSIAKLIGLMNAYAPSLVRATILILILRDTVGFSHVRPVRKHTIPRTVAQRSVRLVCATMGCVMRSGSVFQEIDLSSSLGCNKTRIARYDTSVALERTMMSFESEGMDLNMIGV